MDWFDREALAARRPKLACPVECIGDQLKGMFETMTSGPLPDRLVQLADALDEAFAAGVLGDARPDQRRDPSVRRIV